MTLRYAFLCIMLAWLSACATTPAPVQFEPESFSSLLERRQFTQARAMLWGQAGMQLQSQERDAFAEQLNTAAGLYVHDLISSAQQWQQQQQWYQAQELYREGLDALPNNIDLQHAHKDFSAAQKQYVDGVKYEMKLHRARILPREIELTRLLSGVDPRDERLRNRLYDMEQEAQSLVLFLTPIAQAAYTAGRYKEAKVYDLQILQLGESRQSRERIAAVDRKFSQDARRRAQSRKQAKEKKRESLWAGYQAALAAGDFQQARKVLGQLDNMGFTGPVAEEEHDRLNTLINRQYEVLIAEGKKYYTRGKLDAAIKSWQRALQLSPENQDLLARIKRAETFQANFQRLSQ